MISFFAQLLLDKNVSYGNYVVVNDNALGRSKQALRRTSLAKCDRWNSGAFAASGTDREGDQCIEPHCRFMRCPQRRLSIGVERPPEEIIMRLHAAPSNPSPVCSNKSLSGEQTGCNQAPRKPCRTISLDDSSRLVAILQHMEQSSAVGEATLLVGAESLPPTEDRSQASLLGNGRVFYQLTVGLVREGHERHSAPSA